MRFVSGTVYPTKMATAEYAEATRVGCTQKAGGLVLVISGGLISVVKVCSVGKRGKKMWLDVPRVAFRRTELFNNAFCVSVGVEESGKHPGFMVVVMTPASLDCEIKFY